MFGTMEVNIVMTLVLVYYVAVLYGVEGLRDVIPSSIGGVSDLIDGRGRMRVDNVSARKITVKGSVTVSKSSHVLSARASRMRTRSVHCKVLGLDLKPMTFNKW